MHGCIAWGPILYLTLIGCAVGMIGCHTNYLTRKDLNELVGERTGKLVISSLDDALAYQQQIRERTDKLMATALTAENLEDRSAAILAASTDAARNLRQTLAAISDAIDTTALNLSNYAHTRI